MKRKTTIITICLIFSLSACSSTTGDLAYPNPSYPNPSGDTTAYPNPSGNDDYLPKPEDANLQRENAGLDSAKLLTMESSPLQFSVNLRGNLPTPCHKLRIMITPPDTKNMINMDVYSVVDSSATCAQVEEPFNVNFGIGSFPAGHYILTINEDEIIEFDV